MASKYKFFIGVIFLLCSCGDPLAVNTPREYDYTTRIKPGEILQEKITFATNLNNVRQNLELVKNKFFCRYEKHSTGDYLIIRTELQNSNLTASPCVNSIYFRSDSLPLDDQYYSLSGDPANTRLTRSSKIIFFDNGKFFERIPSQASGPNDNLEIKLSYTNDMNEIHAEYRYKIRLDVGTGEKDFLIEGTFTIKP